MAQKELTNQLKTTIQQVKQKRDQDLLGSPATQKELVNEAERLEVKTKAPLILAELLFDQNILAQVKKHRLLLLRFTHEDKKAQKYLIGGIEQVVAMHKDTLMVKVPILLKSFYDLDILSEGVIIEWADKVGRMYNMYFFVVLKRFILVCFGEEEKKNYQIHAQQKILLGNGHIFHFFCVNK